MEVPMLTVRKSEDRGHADFGWLNSRHSFSFGQYHDPKHMGFGPLRVINDDRVVAGAGFDTHGHRDMEIISYVLEGALAHKDSLGTGSEIRPGDVQRMSAGTGIRHSEFNASKTEPVHFLQIWIMPEAQGIAPSYEQKHFPAAERQGKLKLVASGAPKDGALKIHQDADLYASLLKSGDSVSFSPKAGRGQWIQVASGAVSVNGTPLKTGDGAAISGEARIDIKAEQDAEILFFDLLAKQ
jgi:hypothetical protein